MNCVKDHKVVALPYIDMIFAQPWGNVCNKSMYIPQHFTFLCLCMPSCCQDHGRHRQLCRDSSHSISREIYSHVLSTHCQVQNEQVLWELLEMILRFPGPTGIYSIPIWKLHPWLKLTQLQLDGQVPINKKSSSVYQRIQIIQFPQMTPYLTCSQCYSRWLL
jgi:hypothetical protein